MIRSFLEGDNVIIFLSEGFVWLIEGGYKIVLKYGLNVIRFDIFEY